MQILPILALTLSGHFCFGHAAESVDSIVAAAKAEDVRKETAKKIVEDGKARAALHARALALSESNSLRVMMVLPTRIPTDSIKYFVDSHPAMPIAHVFVPLMAVAQMELDLATRYGIGVGLVQTELNHLIALANLGLEKPKASDIRQVTDRFKPVLGAAFAEEMIRTLAETKAESPDANVVLPPLFENLSGHLFRAMKTARRLTRHEVEAVDVHHWLEMPMIKVIEPRANRGLDEGHSETPVPLNQVSREFNAPACPGNLVTVEQDEPVELSLRSFTDR